jgi:hypothetical protein
MQSSFSWEHVARPKAASPLIPVLYTGKRNTIFEKIAPASKHRGHTTLYRKIAIQCQPQADYITILREIPMFFERSVILRGLNSNEKQTAKAHCANARTAHGNIASWSARDLTESPSARASIPRQKRAAKRPTKNI